MRFPHLILVLAITATTVIAAPPRFERDVLPILAKHCHGCHGAKQPRRSLDLRSIQSLVDGGLSGVIAVPGKPEQSYLYQMVRRGAMPPRGKTKLSEPEVETIRTWIADGMAATEDYTIPPRQDPITPQDREHWAFGRLATPTVPRPTHAQRVATPIDAFIQTRLEDAGLSLARSARRDTLLRRISLDVLGIPPTPGDREDFLADRRYDAYERLVDRLLASPRFGQRWGRHWLDVAGYADTVGFDHGPNQVIMTEGKWRYRDYVIDAFNNDYPFDRFLQEQLAGDELVEWKTAARYSPGTVRNLVATGFLRTSRDQTHESVGVVTPSYYEVLYETMDVVAGGLLGLSVKCARCHDHKFDAIPQRDYYRLMATLMTSYNPTDWRPVYPFDQKVNDRSLLDVSTKTRQEIDVHNGQLDRGILEHQSQIQALRSVARQRLLEKKSRGLPAAIRADVLAAIAQDAKRRTEIQAYLTEKFEKSLAISDPEVTGELNDKEKNTIATEEAAIATLQSQRRAYGRIQALFDVGTAPTTFVLKRGRHEYPGPPVEPGVLGVLCDTPEQAVLQPTRAPNGSSGRRLALARWLTSADTRASALVSRVLINRFWQALFGRGLVASAGDFGVQGTEPTHPQLLEWLCRDFQRHGWRIKPLLRTILLSHTYRQTSRPTDSRQAKLADPDNRLLWRMSLRRLESESIRDSLLAVAGQLDSSLGGPPVPQQALPDGRIRIPLEKLKQPFDHRRRSVYLVTRRGYSLTLLDVFDQPAILTTCSQRQTSAVPLQSLAMINGPFVYEQSTVLAEQAVTTAGQDVDRLIETLYQRALCREPVPRERMLCRQALAADTESFHKAGHDRTAARRQAVIELAHTLLNTSEFLYRE